MLLGLLALVARPALAQQASPLESARTVLEQASQAMLAGDYLKALPLAERAVGLAEKGDDRALLGRALVELGRARWGRGQYDPALEAHTRALAIFRDLDDSVGQTEALLRTGETFYSLGRYDEALATYEQALAANQRGGSPQRESNIRSNMGSALRSMGRLDEAAAATEQALGIARGLDNPSFAGQALVFLGIINRARAEYQKAIAAYDEAIAIRRRLGDRRGEAQALGNLGNVYNDLGEFEKAIDCHTRSLAIAQEIGYTAQVAFARNNLGTVMARLGREALPHYEQALAAWRQMNRQAETARTLKEIAVQRRLVKADAAGARTALDEALSIARRLGERDAEGYVLLELGALERTEGRIQLALARLDEGMALVRAMGEPQLEFELLAERGRAYLSAGERERGIADLRKGAAIVSDVRSRVRSDDAKIAFVDTRQAVFHDLAEALLAADRPGEALEAAEAGRARAFADVLLARQVQGRPAERGLLDDLRAALTVRVSAAPESSQRGGEAVPAILDRLRRQNEELVSLVAAESPRLDEVRATAARLDATIVEYLVTERALLAWVVSPGGEVHASRTELDKKQLVKLVSELLATLDDAGVVGRHTTVKPHGHLRELHRLLIAPLSTWLPPAPAARVVFVPHGPLAQVPLAALEDERGTPLVTRYTLSIAPAISLFRYTAAKRGRHTQGAPLILAAPQTPGAVDLPRLPGSLDEGRRVAARLDRYRPALLEADRASERNAKAGIGAARYVHFAAHGLVSDLRPADSSIVLAEGDGEDGYLRAAEVYSLELSAELVVLSGCATARGRLGGDGVFGLPRAFLYAGAPSVVGSLWDISDRATVFLMDRFYAELLRGGDKAAALRSAQLATRQRYGDPALWAPFVLIGEPR